MGKSFNAFTPPADPPGGMLHQSVRFNETDATTRAHNLTCMHLAVDSQTRAVNAGDSNRSGAMVVAAVAPGVRSRCCYGQC